MWEPPRMTLAPPVAGPVGATSGRALGWSVVHQSAHHSQTLPAVLYRPKPLDSKAFTGAVAR